jgi:heme-degrading monooxygenase HmoA
MIVRHWRGVASTATANAYARHATETVFPSLAKLAGHRGAWLLRRDADGQTEFVALTLWDTLDSIRAFAGDDISTAIVEPEGQAALRTYDNFATHYEVVFRSGP